MQIQCDIVTAEAYALPNLEYLNFFQPQVKNALKILKFDEPLYGAFIELENEELNKNNKILKLEKANEQKDKQIKIFKKKRDIKNNYWHLVFLSNKQIKVLMVQNIMMMKTMKAISLGMIKKILI